MKRKVFWFVTNVYGKLLGWSWLSTFHHAMVTMSLHALGYGNMYRETWTGEKWFIREILAKKNPKISLDVGANIGNYCRMLQKYTDSKIFAFEPNPSSYAKLSELSDEVVKIQKAVGNKAGQAKLYFSMDCDGMASLDSRIREGNEVAVEVTTLEQFANENNLTNIDFLKIDTEGLEREVIEGLGKLRPNIIQFEFNINHLVRDVTLKSITDALPGYTYYRLLPNGWLKFDPELYINNIFIFSNVVAVKNGVVESGN